MKIAIDVSPLESGHKVRGVGFYLQYLKKSLVENYPEHNYQFFTKQSEIPVDTDVVHYPYFDPFFLTLPFQKKYKTVVTVHDLTPLVFPTHFPAGIKGSIRWQIQKYNLRKVNAVIADSFASKDDIVRIAGIPVEKVYTVHLAAGEEFQRNEKGERRDEKLRKKYNLPKEFVLYVGDVTWNKNVSSLVKAIKKTSLTLVMVGKTLVSENVDTSNSWNNDLVEVQKLVKEDKQFMRLGFVPDEDLVTLYNSASVFVFPSIYEGFGLPVIEAMQSGCPVITTKGGSLKEVAGDAALFVDPNSVEDIAESITKVVSNKSLQKSLSQKGLEQAKKFSWKKTAKETIAVYEKVTAVK